MRRSKSGAATPCRRGGRPDAGSDPSARSMRPPSRASATKCAPDPRDADELHDTLVTVGLLLRSRSRCADARAPARARCRRPRLPCPTRPLVGDRGGRASTGAPRHSSGRGLDPQISAPPSRADRLGAWRGDCRAGARPLLHRRSDDRGGPRGRFRRRAGRHRTRGARARGRRRHPARTILTRRRRTPVVRSRAPVAHPSLHPQSPPCRDRAGDAGRFHAVPVQVAASRCHRPADRPRWPARSPCRTRWIRAAGRRLGTRRAPLPSRPITIRPRSTCCA